MKKWFTRAGLWAAASAAARAAASAAYNLELEKLLLAEMGLKR